MRLKLTIVDSVGFGDQIDKSDRYASMYYYVPLCQVYVLRSIVSIFRRHVRTPMMCHYFSYKKIVDYIDQQFENYLQEELKVKRMLHSYHDSRIHACLYFVAPTGHS